MCVNKHYQFLTTGPNVSSQHIITAHYRLGSPSHALQFTAHASRTQCMCQISSSAVFIRANFRQTLSLFVTDLLIDLYENADVL